MVDELSISTEFLTYSSYQLYSEMVGGRIFKRIGREYKGRNHDSDRIELKIS